MRSLSCQKILVRGLELTEVNFDGLVGPTHNYSGLAFGNIASTSNQGLISSPRRAALQGLEKMKYLHDLGIKQAILPPQPRPALDLLRRHCELSLHGEGEAMQSISAEELVAYCYKNHPQLLSAFSSASCMWTANAATVSPSADAADGRLHLTAANLASSLHRSIEANFTYGVLKQIFSDANHFSVHEAIDSQYGDEGAANHCRFAASHGTSGIELFVYGNGETKPNKYPARQSLTASMLVAEQHQLDPSRCIFAQQNPEAIDAGVFHNDVISVSNENLFIYHERAFANTEQVLGELRDKWSQLSNNELYLIKASSSDLSLDDAVKSYLYNSQIITLTNGEILLIAPLEARENPNAYKHIQKIISDDNPVTRVEFLDLRESMRNGGGPACLRLRMVMSAAELAAMKQSVIFTEQLYKELKELITKNYREELSPGDLGDMGFVNEVKEVVKEIYSILQLTI